MQRCNRTDGAIKTEDKANLLQKPYRPRYGFETAVPSCVREWEQPRILRWKERAREGGKDKERNKIIHLQRERRWGERDVAIVTEARTSIWPNGFGTGICGSEGQVLSRIPITHILPPDPTRWEEDDGEAFYVRSRGEWWRNVPTSSTEVEHSNTVQQRPNTKPPDQPVQDKYRRDGGGERDRKKYKQCKTLPTLRARSS